MTDLARFDRNMAAPLADENGLCWYNPAQPPFRLCGFYWFQKEGIYRRLPQTPPWTLPEAVDSLADHTAGGLVRFRTDSRRISVRLENRAPGRMDHMPDSGRAGVDLYVDGLFYAVLRRSEFEGPVTVELAAFETTEMRDFTLHLPLYGTVKSLKIGLDEGAKFAAPLPFQQTKKVVYYGTSIAQGGCASHPGMLFTNILSRRLNVEFLNFGFSGSAKCEPEVAHVLAEVEDPALLVIDCDANVPDAAFMMERLPKFVEILRGKHPVTPLVIVSRTLFARDERQPEALKNREEKFRVQKNLVARRRAAGDLHCHFVDGRRLLGRDHHDCTVDGVHPTDLGFHRMAKALEPHFRRLLNEAHSK